MKKVCDERQALLLFIIENPGMTTAEIVASMDGLPATFNRLRRMAEWGEIRREKFEHVYEDSTGRQRWQRTWKHYAVVEKSRSYSEISATLAANAALKHHKPPEPKPRHRYEHPNN